MREEEALNLSKVLRTKGTLSRLISIFCCLHLSLSPLGLGLIFLPLGLGLGLDFCS